ncbi:MAG: MotA/TolQ/ExbB proton channel family protein [Oscillospiraceae bacterium]|jgi:hypothetical protein|nr:MotA/TolQ/ExbB proton channel family protein [Oscillospiraceae bacterium]
MGVVLRWLGQWFPDALFYGLTALALVLGLVKCTRPLLGNAAALRRAADLLEKGARAKLARPVWADPAFLGKPLAPAWRAFLRTAETARGGGVPCNVADVLNEESVILLPGKAALAEIIPGICTSLGILGTFVGLSMGINGLDISDLQSYITLTTGIALAFNTSIVGIVASLLFNTLQKFSVGRASAALDRFYAAFYAYGIQQPPAPETQLLAYQREQTGALSQFAHDMSVNLAEEIHNAIAAAMAPVQRSMDDFLNAATRAQIDGLDFVVSRFIDRMNTLLDGQLTHLRESLSDTAEGQSQMQTVLADTLNALRERSEETAQTHEAARQMVEQFVAAVERVDAAAHRAENTQTDTVELLDQLGQASERQARYLSALQKYQVELQGSFQDYTLWTDKFVTGLEERTNAQNESLEQVAAEMHASAELLRGAYKSFVESVELGLSGTLGLFDVNMQKLMQQVQGTLSEIETTMVSLEEAMTRAAAAAQGVDREVS